MKMVAYPFVTTCALSVMNTAAYHGIAGAPPPAPKEPEEHKETNEKMVMVLTPEGAVMRRKK